jgi:hypothetical protein
MQSGFSDAKIKNQFLFTGRKYNCMSVPPTGFFHNHSQDPIIRILHVVFQHDIEVMELTEKSVPALELKSHIDENMVWKYEKLIDGNQFIPCENI